MEATSTPMSLSLVLMSAPANRAAESPCKLRGDDVGHLVAGRHQADRSCHSRARTRRWRKCPDRRCGSASSITMPPRSPTARPAARASSSRGRMPAENTIRSVSSSLPSANRRRWRALAAVGDRGRLSCRVDAHAELARCARAACGRRASSICTAMSRGANSTTWVSSPRSLQRLRRLETQQAAADDHATLGSCALRAADGVEILDGAIDEAAGTGRCPGIGGTKG